jgi:nucleoid-associated protein YgaU
VSGSSVLDAAPPPALVPPVQPLAVSESPTAVPARQATTYVVQRGDQLRYIAARYGVSVGSILALNAIPDPDSLTVGAAACRASCFSGMTPA